jgi:hypothetical protein
MIKINCPATGPVSVINQYKIAKNEFREGGKVEKKTLFHSVIHCHLAALLVLHVSMCNALWEEKAHLLDILHLRC